MNNAQSGPVSARGLSYTFRALRYRNYRLFYTGQGISLIGTWMQSLAMSWLVYRLTGSEFLLGVVGFASQIASFVISPFAGVLIDRWNRHRVIVTTQSLAMLQAFTLAALVLTGHIQVWEIIALSVFLGGVNGFDMPARQSFVIEMVENREDLSNAIALNSSMFNGARLVGPAIAGLIIARTSAGVCFLINAISYVAVVIALLAMRVTPRHNARASNKVTQDLVAGFQYAFGYAPIRAILLILALVSLVGAPYAVLMPVFAKDVLHGGPRTLGLLVSSIGVGALVGAMFMASRGSVLGLGRWIPTASVIFGCGLIAFSFSRSVVVSMVFLVFCGFGMMVQMASSNTILQTLADEEKRGRLMSFYTMSFLGTAPFGSLLAGGLASSVGAPVTVRISGFIVIAAAMIFASRLPALRRVARPRYEELGIISPMDSGIPSADEPEFRPQELPEED